MAAVPAAAYVEPLGSPGAPGAEPPYPPPGVAEQAAAGPPQDRPGRTLVVGGIVLLVVVAAVAAVLGWQLAAGERLGAGPSASTAPAAVVSTVQPAASGSSAVPGSAVPSLPPMESPDPSASLEPSPSVAPSPTPRPARVAINLVVEHKPAAVFISEQTKRWCAASAVQMVLNVNGPKVNTTKAYQTTVHDTEVALTTHADSRNGGAGPLGMAATLNKLGRIRYELRIFPTRAQAVRATAIAISATKHPVIWMAWRGAHAWVVTGYKADADPRFFRNASIKGVYVLDPWYPRVSSIWGPSDPPGTFQDAAEMKRNFLPWKRPEGHYASRDGQFLVLMPKAAPKS